MSENRLTIGIVKGGGSVFAKFSRRRGRPPPITFARIVRPMNALDGDNWPAPAQVCSVDTAVPGI